jgi:hypothetical protein
MEGAMKVGVLGTGFGIAHARIYHTHPQVSEVVVFGRTPAKPQAFADDLGRCPAEWWALRLIVGVYSPLSIAAMPPVSLVGLSWAMDPSDR